MVVSVVVMEAKEVLEDSVVNTVSALAITEAMADTTVTEDSAMAVSVDTATVTSVDTVTVTSEDTATETLEDMATTKRS